MVKVIVKSKVVEVPEGVGVEVVGRRVTVRGPLGEVERDFSHSPVGIRLEDNGVVVETVWPDKKRAAMVGTIGSHIRNIIVGVTKGFTYKLKMVFAHFPISVKVQGNKIVIENFGGERKARIAEIVGETKVSVGGDEILVRGINLEDVSQTAANIQQATRIKKKDPRVFLDGIYLQEKGEGM